MEKDNRVAVIIVNYRTPDLALDCVRSLVRCRETFPGLEVVLVDGGSGDGSAAQFAAEVEREGWGDWVRLLALQVNGGFAFANNRALHLLAEDGEPPEYVALVNPDARCTSGALEAMAALLDREPGAGAVGALLIAETGEPQASAFRFPSWASEFCRGARTGLVNRVLRQESSTLLWPESRCQVPWVTGAAVMFRTLALRATGLFDEGFFLYFEETELMWRLNRAGWRIWHEPAARVVHLGGVSTGIRDPKTGGVLRKRMPRYWYESRRRYFSLVGGRGHALGASLSWLAGHLIWLVRRSLTFRREDSTLRPALDLLAYGFFPSARSGRAALSTFRSAPRATPAWMKEDNA